MKVRHWFKKHEASLSFSDKGHESCLFSLKFEDGEVIQLNHLELGLLFYLLAFGLEP